MIKIDQFYKWGTSIERDLFQNQWKDWYWTKFDWREICVEYGADGNHRCHWAWINLSNQIAFSFTMMVIPGVRSETEILPGNSDFLFNSFQLSSNVRSCPGYLSTSDKYPSFSVKYSKLIAYLPILTRRLLPTYPYSKYFTIETLGQRTSS